MENKYNIEDLKKENQFAVPTSYFEELPLRINQRKTNTNNRTLFSAKLWYKFLAPTFVVIVLFVGYFMYQNNENDAVLTNQQLSKNIINHELVEFDEELIYEVYTETANTPNANATQDEEIIDYLINDNININQITEEL